ncbi:hypothetical protein HK405_015288, partial [Cladochytrium tenue]
MADMGDLADGSDWGHLDSAADDPEAGGGGDDSAVDSPRPQRLSAAFRVPLAAEDGSPRPAPRRVSRSSIPAAHDGSRVIELVSDRTTELG